MKKSRMPRGERSTLERMVVRQGNEEGSSSSAGSSVSSLTFPESGGLKERGFDFHDFEIPAVPTTPKKSRRRNVILPEADATANENVTAEAPPQNPRSVVILPDFEPPTGVASRQTLNQSMHLSESPNRFHLETILDEGLSERGFELKDFQVPRKGQRKKKSKRPPKTSKQAHQQKSSRKEPPPPQSSTPAPTDDATSDTIGKQPVGSGSRSSPAFHRKRKQRQTQQHENVYVDSTAAHVRPSLSEQYVTSSCLHVPETSSECFQEEPWDVDMLVLQSCYHEDAHLLRNDQYTCDDDPSFSSQDCYPEYNGRHDPSSSSASCHSLRYRDFDATRSHHLRGMTWPNEAIPADPYRENIMPCDLQELSSDKYGKPRTTRMWQFGWCMALFGIAVVVVALVVRKSIWQSGDATPEEVPFVQNPFPGLRIQTDPRFIHDWATASFKNVIQDYQLHPLDLSKISNRISIATPLVMELPLPQVRLYMKAPGKVLLTKKCSEWIDSLPVMGVPSGDKVMLTAPVRDTQVIACMNDQMVASATHFFVRSWEGAEKPHQFQVLDFNNSGNHTHTFKKADDTTRLYLLAITISPNQHIFYTSNGHAREMLNHMLDKSPTRSHRCDGPDGELTLDDPVWFVNPVDTVSDINSEIVVWELTDVLRDATTSRWSTIAWVCDAEEEFMHKPAAHISVERRNALGN